MPAFDLPVRLRVNGEVRTCVKSRAMNCGPLSEMIRGFAPGYFSFGSFENHLDVCFVHLLPQIPMQ
jgi:hypothetical protein